MTKKPKRQKKKKTKAKAKKAIAKAPRRRRTRIRPIVGPFQIELPLQMPLFPHEPSVAPVREAPSSTLPSPAGVPPSEPSEAPRPPGNSQPLLMAPSIAS